MPPRIHATVDLMSLLPSQWFADMEADSLGEIDNNHTITRYPDALPGALSESSPRRGEAEEAISLARAVLEKARQLIRTSE